MLWVISVLHGHLRGDALSQAWGNYYPVMWSGYSRRLLCGGKTILIVREEIALV